MDLDAPYTPSRAERLQVELARAVDLWIKAWNRRVVASVVVVSADRAVIVTLTQANGQVEPESNLRARYIAEVQTVAQTVLSRYEWASGLKLTVQFV